MAQGQDNDAPVPWQAILGIERELAALREMVARHDERQKRQEDMTTQWQVGAKSALDALKAEFASLRHDIQRSLSGQNVIMVETGKRVDTIEKARIAEQAEIKGGWRALGVVGSVAGAISGAVVWVLTFLSEHWK